MSAEQTEIVGAAAESAAESRRGMVAKLLPEISTLLILLLLWLELMPSSLLAISSEEALIWLVGLEGATLLFMVTLVDIASRLKQAPPWWLGVLLAAGLLLMYPDIVGLLVVAWQQGFWVFAPLLWSLGERLRELWTLPAASHIEKLRRRALSFGRLCTGLVLAGVLVIAILGHAIFLDDGRGSEVVSEKLGLPLLSLFYLIAMYDAWRVHQPAFAERPRSLWPFFDDNETANLRPL